MSHIEVQNQIPVFIPYRIHSQIQLESLVGNLAHIVLIWWETGRWRQCDGCDQIHSSLVIVRGSCVDKIVPQSQFGTEVQSVGGLPFQLGIAQCLQDSAITCLVPFIGKYHVGRSCVVSREISLTGLSERASDFQTVDPAEIFHEIVLVYVDTKTTGPERSESFISSESGGTVKTKRGVEKVGVIVGIVYWCQSTQHPLGVLIESTFLVHFLGIHRRRKQTRRESNVSHVFRSGVVLPEVKSGKRVYRMLLYPRVVRQSGRQIYWIAIIVAHIVCSGRDVLVTKREEVATLLGLRVIERVRAVHLFRQAQLSLEQQRRNYMPVHGQIVNDLLSFLLRKIMQGGLIHRVLLVDRGTTAPIAQLLKDSAILIHVLVIRQLWDELGEVAIWGISGISLRIGEIVSDIHILVVVLNISPSAKVVSLGALHHTVLVGILDIDSKTKRIAASINVKTVVVIEHRP